MRLKIKKILCAAAVLVLAAAGAQTNAQMYGADEFAALTGSSAEVANVFENSTTLPLDAAAVILVERSTGAVLYEQNADAQRAIASITKVMTLILVMDAVESGAITLQDTVTCSEHAYSMGGSQIWLEPGETMSVDELLRAVAVASANDAAVALAEYVSGSETEFVAAMNRRAAELGMSETTFMNSNGLDEPGHVSSARDVSIMSRELLRHELVRQYITTWTDELRGGETQLTNTNKLLRRYEGISGVKTGTTNDAGVCISASAQRGDMELIAVVLGSSCSAGRFEAAETLLDYGFANYELASVNLPQQALAPIRVRLGCADYCQVTVEVPQAVVVKKGAGDTVQCDYTAPDALDAPVTAGEIVGTVTVYCGEQVLSTHNITVCETVDKLTLPDALRLLLDALFEL